MAFQAKALSFNHCQYYYQYPLHSPTSLPSSLVSTPFNVPRKSAKLFTCRSSAQEDDYLIDAPVSAGDGFSFSGGKYADGPSPSDEWFKQGKYAYSYRKVLPVLSRNYHAIAFDWLGFGFSDKPQPRYGFDYTLDEYVSSLDSFINEVAKDKVSLIVQGYFSPVVVKYASKHQDRVKDLTLLNPPVTTKHANLPSTLSIFSNFLLGEIFSQDPLRASDKALTSSGPYKMKEDDAMVYRRPYLTSGSAGFALNAISRAMKKDLKAYVEEMRRILSDKDWNIPTTVFWGLRDRWLNYDGVEEFCKDSLKLIELPMAGHHVQEDCGEELAGLISGVISKSRV